MSTFSIVMLTASPPGLAGEAGGAFVKIDGREALLRSVELFLNRENVKQIQVVVLPEAMEEARRKYGGHLAFSGVKLLSGGPRWIDQISVAAEKISAEISHVIVHDAARPVLPYTDLEAVMEAAEKHAAVALVTPVRCSLVEVDEGSNPVAQHLPSRFLQLLTPQAFSREKFLEMAKSKTEIHPSEWTLVKGSPLNVRIGGAGDATLAKNMLNLLPKAKSKAPLTPFDEAQW